MPSRQPRWPSIGLASWSERTFAIICSSRSRPMWCASRRVYSSRRSVYLGRNSWSGGSRRRIVTGSPSIARKIPMKSLRWNGRSFFTAAWRAAESVAMIISRTIGIRSAAKNMCSVRTRPMPSAPNSRAFFASSGVSAFARTPSVRARSAQPRNSLTSSESCGGISFTVTMMKLSPPQLIIDTVKLIPPQLSDEVKEFLGELRRDQLHRIDDDLTGVAVDRDQVPLPDRAAARFEHAPFLVHDNVVRADDAALSHADRDDRRVRRTPAARGDDAFGGVHAGHVLGGRLRAHEDDPLAVPGGLHRSIGVEDHVSDGSPGRGGQPPSEQAPVRDRPLRVLRVQHGEKELSELARRHAEQRGVLIDDALAHEVHGHAHRGGGRALAGACLQEVEPALLDGELDVLHVLVVALEAIGDVEQLVVDRGHPALEVVDTLGRADAGHDVLALSVGEELRVEVARAGARVPREPDAGPGRLAEVAEDHRHHRDGGPPVPWDAVDPPVLGGLLGEPGIEHGVDREAQLLVRILRERRASARAHDVLERLGEFLELVRGYLRIALHAEASLHGLELGVEGLALDAEHDPRERRDESPVAVPGEAVVLGPRGEPEHRRVVEAEVEDGLHHARHGRARGRADGDEERTRGMH